MEHGTLIDQLFDLRDTDHPEIVTSEMERIIREWEGTHNDKKDQARGHDGHSVDPLTHDSRTSAPRSEDADQRTHELLLGLRRAEIRQREASAILPQTHTVNVICVALSVAFVAALIACLYFR